MSEETQEKKTKDQQNDRGGNQCGDSNFKRKNERLFQQIYFAPQCKIGRTCGKR